MPADDEGGVAQFEPPGVSASLYLKGIPQKPTLRKIVEGIVGRPYERTDHLHPSPIAWIKEAGWEAFWTPLLNHRLHLRLVAHTTLNYGLPPTDEDSTRIRDAFVKAI